MGKSLMPNVANVLGVELGEKFKIKKDNGLPFAEAWFRVAERGLEEQTENEGWHKASNAVLEPLLSGILEIVRTPWKPQVGEIYYRPSNAGIISETVWSNTNFDCAFYALGMVYRTFEAAEAHLQEDYQRLTGEEWKG